MDVVTEATKLIETRLEELGAEKKQLESALSNLNRGKNGRYPKPGRPWAPRKRTGTREEQALALIAKHPEGLTGAEIAEALGITPNHAYKTLNTIAKKQLAEKRDKRYFPKKDAAPVG